MIIDMLNTGASGGGAAVAAQRLHRGLLNQGIDSRLWHKPPRKRCEPKSDLEHPTVRSIQLPGAMSLHDRLGAIRQKYEKKRAMRGRPRDLEIFSTPWARSKNFYDTTQLVGDVLHLHWINNWIDWPSFFSSQPDDLPIVWTLHDMNPFTGGCHHADQCEAFHSHCGNCPQLALPRRGPNDLAARGFAEKLRAYSEKNLHIVTPSRWLQRHAENSRLLRAATIRTIHNGLDTRQFTARDKLQARQELGLPANKTIIGFGAASLKNPRKGASEFFQAMSLVRNQEEILCLGFGEHAAVPDQLRLPEIRTTGYLHTPDQLASVYSAADLFVMPSLGENMPQTVIESMSCATPVVAFRVGGIPEVVIPGQTGLLADLRDCGELAKQIQWMVDHPDQRRQMGRQARIKVESEFDLERQTATYVRLYENVVGSVATTSGRPLRRSA